MAKKSKIDKQTKLDKIKESIDIAKSKDFDPNIVHKPVTMLDKRTKRKRTRATKKDEAINEQDPE